MSRNPKLPSKWWFWGIPVLATCYVCLLAFMIGVAKFPLPRWGTLELVASIIFVPGMHFLEFGAGPLVQFALGENVADHPLLLLGLWELSALLVGTVLYGLALLGNLLVVGDGGATEADD